MSLFIGMSRGWPLIVFRAVTILRTLVVKYFSGLVLTAPMIAIAKTAITVNCRIANLILACCALAYVAETGLAGLEKQP
jgi:hypothetical protein